MILSLTIRKWTWLFNDPARDGRSADGLCNVAPCLAERASCLASSLNFLSEFPSKNLANLRFMFLSTSFKHFVSNLLLNISRKLPAQICLNLLSKLLVRASPNCESARLEVRNFRQLASSHCVEYCPFSLGYLKMRARF